jgi:hypothetical protein
MAQRVVAATLMFSDGEALTPFVQRVQDSAPDAFDDLRYGSVVRAIRELRSKGKLVHQQSILESVQFPDAGQVIGELTGADMSMEVAEGEAKLIWEAFKPRRMAALLDESQKALLSSPHLAPNISEHVQAELHSLQSESKGTRERLSALEFKPGIEPPPLRTIYTLAGQTIATPGNIVTITSAIKTGKTAVIGAMVASTFPHSIDADLLGFKSCNPKDHAVLRFDSEQSPDDSWHCNHQSLRRAGLTDPPAWFHAYRLTGLGYKRAWECIVEAIHIAIETHGGIHSMLVDGVADLVSDVNDAGESNAFVATVHGMAIKNDCPIIGVIHFNPGSDKSRGHLGSQLERKAETNLALEKDSEEVTVIYSTKNRRAGIPKSIGPRFRYSAEAGMHVSVESQQQAKDECDRQQLTELAQDIFGQRPAMRYSEIQPTVKKALTVSDRTAERKVMRMRELGIIKRSVAGLYTIGS